MTRTIAYFFALALLLSSSCTDVQDFTNDSKDYTANQWIESTLRERYYWYKDMPEASKLDYNLNGNDFFDSLLSDKDGKDRYDGTHQFYSTIYEKSGATTKSYLGDEPSLGFEYQWYYVTDINRNALRILYILPNSPATSSGLKRGDWIYEINNQNVSKELIEKLNSGAEMKLGVSSTITPQITKYVTLSAQRVEDNPVFSHKVLNINNKKIAYLAYNHFTDGTGGVDQTFNNSMRKAFSEFKEINPDEFILDLRYNGGGLVTCAQLLSSLLAPADALGDVFCHLTDNKDETSTFNLDKTVKENINLKNKRLFVITSTFTASASEAVINGLKPYMNDQLIVVGEQTEGKNVGSIPFEDERYKWELNPIVCKISNKDHSSDYENGFLPTLGFECSEPVSEDLLDLSDPKEYILSRILAFIETGTPIEAQTTRSMKTNNTNIIPLGSSLDRKKTNGVVIDIE